MVRETVDSITSKKQPFSARSKVGAQSTGRRREPFNFRRGGVGILKIGFVAILIKLGLKKL